VNEAESEEENKEDEGDDDRTGVERSKKQLQKEAKRQEKQAQREGMKQAIEQKSRKDDEYRKRQDEREMEEAERERKEEEVIKQLQEEKKKQEEDDYIKWKDMFTVDEAGKETENMENEENLLQKFVEYIKLRKVVVLDYLAAEFKLNTKDVMSRIKSLEASKALSGVIDDRGKYIYITDQEFEEVANYIKKKGRVSRADLLIECNKIIKLNPSERDKERILQEESKLLKDIESEFLNIEDQLMKDKSPGIPANA